MAWQTNGRRPDGCWRGNGEEPDVSDNETNEHAVEDGSCLADLVPPLRPVVRRDDVRRAIWRITGWQIESAQTEELLRVIDGYVRSVTKGAATDFVLAVDQVSRPEPPAATMPATVALPVPRERDDDVIILDEPGAKVLLSPAHAAALEPTTDEHSDPQPDTQPVMGALSAGVLVPNSGGRLRYEPVVVGESKCIDCGEGKHVLEFTVDRSRKNGRRSRCKECETRRQQDRLNTARHSR
jgi:hypothetical protein